MEINVQTSNKEEFIDITYKIKELININNGLCIVYCPHTTSGLTINEGADPSVQHDIIKILKKLVPENGYYHHLEGNSDAHIKASLLGSSLTVLIENKRLLLGTWQHIFLYEGDGPRNRRIYVDIISH